jgi:hypothetical protein
VDQFSTTYSLCTSPEGYDRVPTWRNRASRAGRAWGGALGVPPIAWRAFVTLLAVEDASERSFATVGRGGPRSVRPRRIMAHVLVVPALEFGHPMLGVVPMKSDDLPFHETVSRPTR